MHRLIGIGAALLFVPFGAVHGSHNHRARGYVRGIRRLQGDEMIAKRQLNNCTSLDNYPERCETAFENVGDFLAISPEDFNLDNFRNDVNDLCTIECGEPLEDYFICSDQFDSLTYFHTILCGVNGNEYCPVVYFEKMVMQDSLDCIVPETTCDESCASKQKTVVTDWGCCAASYYNYLRARCDVGAGDLCVGLLVGDAGIVNRVGLGLITVFAMVAAFANAALF